MAGFEDSGVLAGLSAGWPRFAPLGRSFRAGGALFAGGGFAPTFAGGGLGGGTLAGGWPRFAPLGMSFRAGGALLAGGGFVPTFARGWFDGCTLAGWLPG